MSKHTPNNLCESCGQSELVYQESSDGNYFKCSNCGHIMLFDDSDFYNLEHFEPIKKSKVYYD